MTISNENTTPFKELNKEDFDKFNKIYSNVTDSSTPVSKDETEFWKSKWNIAVENVTKQPFTILTDNTEITTK